MWEFLATIHERIKENRRVALRDGRRPPVDIERRNQAEALEIANRFSMFVDTIVYVQVTAVGPKSQIA